MEATIEITHSSKSSVNAMDKIIISAFFSHKMAVSPSANKGNLLLLFGDMAVNTCTSWSFVKNLYFKLFHVHPNCISLHLLDILLYILVNVYENKMLLKHAKETFYFCPVLTPERNKEYDTGVKDILLVKQF